MICPSSPRRSDTSGNSVESNLQLISLLREELSRARTSQMTALAERETEIAKLKDKINFRSKLSGPREEELR